MVTLSENLIRRELHQLQDERCFYCDMKHYGGAATVDHFIPKSKGGLDVWGNAVMCCKECNERKSNRIPSQEDLERFLPLHAMFMQRLQEMHDIEWSVNDMTRPALKGGL